MKVKAIMSTEMIAKTLRNNDKNDPPQILFQKGFNNDDVELEYTSYFFEL